MQLLPISYSTVSVVPDAKERQLLPSQYQPSEIDIVCERGKAFAQHPGNKKFSEAIRSNLQRYVEAHKRVDKSLIVAYVTSSLRQGGGRFIKLDNKSKRYYEISQDQAHGKTGHAIRDLLKLRAVSKKPSNMVVASRTYSHGVVRQSKESDLFKLRAPSIKRSKMVVASSRTYSHGVVGLSKESYHDSTTVMMGRGHGRGPLIRSHARSRNIFLVCPKSAW
jgi:hypothetical protein